MLSNGSTPMESCARSSSRPRTELSLRGQRRSLVALGVTLVFAACSRGAATSSPATPLPTVVVVSFDALGDRYLDRDTLPQFKRLAVEGVRAPFRPQFPSKTFPNHYSMATGL